MITGAGRRVAFYAPLKSPHHPVPSGDREMARNLMAIIAAGGASVDLVSELKIYDKRGDRALQEDLHAQAKTEADRLIRTLPDMDLWVTYHNYYKAPDLIGPIVAHARNIPYVQIESTRATSRLTGSWAGFAASAHRACDAADVIFYLTANDLITLKRERFENQNLVHFPPFLPTETLPSAARLTGPMLTAGMMRSGDKLASYQIIAKTLAHLTGDWSLQIAGDGPARAEVETLMAPFGPRVTFLGQLDRTEMAAAYANASLFLWPGVNEAFGMVYLEAQGHGLPVVAQDRPGLRDVLLPGTYPTPEDGPKALAHQITGLLTDPALRASLGTAARRMISKTHLAPAATARFWSAVTPLLEATT
ncbi:glycosyltransferase family 4 protein [Parasedimentitalea maritima]|uniref:Glycosyltransferase family 4 protein n=1 Tax=Parasedimentitalea maritima TaxID=2578117 RepID=A0ABY2V1M8_9RHOB|nr:glycosyltransferase family 4 protein [Zongyanglinia marina]TLP69272.1 glycosyltransferase family 4 protein [Zongyanglinia marina]